MTTKRLPLRSVVAAGVAASVAATLVLACADDADPPALPAPDASVTIDANAADVAVPDATAADVDASARTCSDDGFCHTALPVESTLRAVWGDGASTVWAVGEEGDVLRWDGAAWTVHATKLGALFAVWGSSPTDVWIGGAAGLLHGTGATPADLVFAPVTTPGNVAVPIRSIWGTGAADVWAVGGVADETGTPRARVVRLRAVDGGVAWALDALSSRPFAFRHVWGDRSGGVWIGGDDGSEYSQTNGLFRRAATAGSFVRVPVTAYAEQEGPEQGGPGALTGAGLGGDGRVVVMGRTLSATPSFWYGGDARPDGGATWAYEGRDPNDPLLRAVWAPDGGPTWVAGDYGRLRRRTGETWSQAAIMIATFPVTEPLYAMWGASENDFWVVGHAIALHRVAGAGAQDR